MIGTINDDLDLIPLPPENGWPAENALWFWYPPSRGTRRQPQFDSSKQCFFCGADNRNEPFGYGGERTCGSCGCGGFGEPDKQKMAYRCNL